MTAKGVQERLRSLANAEYAVQAARYFKTGPGQYGEGDIFLGIRSAPLKQVAKEFTLLPFPEVQALLRSEVHEDRMTALLILVSKFQKGTAATQKQVYQVYLRHTKHINNWDLVDVSARDIVGGYLADRAKDPLFTLTRSASVWERRISIVATHEFIRRREFTHTFAIAESLLGDPHDLIHKAVGWMLREVGKRDEAALEGFLRRHSRSMPRTALRYAIERFGPEKRLSYLKGMMEEIHETDPLTPPNPALDRSSPTNEATPPNRRRSASASRRAAKD